METRGFTLGRKGEKGKRERGEKIDDDIFLFPFPLLTFSPFSPFSLQQSTSDPFEERS
jgi:hypothetical protein